MLCELHFDKKLMIIFLPYPFRNPFGWNPVISALIPMFCLIWVFHPFICLFCSLIFFIPVPLQVPVLARLLLRLHPGTETVQLEAKPERSEWHNPPGVSYKVYYEMKIYIRERVRAAVSSFHCCSFFLRKASVLKLKWLQASFGELFPFPTHSWGIIQILRSVLYCLKIVKIYTESS